MPQDPKIRRICFDRVIPEGYNPARSMTHRAAVTHYVSTIHTNSKASASGASPGATFGQHIAAIEKLGELSPTDPIAVARMAVINLKKWDNGHNLRCRFLDGDNTQQRKVAEKA